MSGTKIMESSHNAQASCKATAHNTMHMQHANSQQRLRIPPITYVYIFTLLNKAACLQKPKTIENIILDNIVLDLSLDIFRFGTSFAMSCFEPLDWKLLLGIFRSGAFA